MNILCRNLKFPVLALLLINLAACGADDSGSAQSPIQNDISMASLLPELALLDQQVTRVSDISQIKRLQRSYGYYLDRSQWNEVVDLLTEDATAEYGLGGVYRGKQQIGALLYGIGYGEAGLQPQQLREHLQLQPVITLSADGMSASGRWRLLGLLGQYQQYARWQTGPYETAYRKENGVWKISKLHWKEDFTVSFVGGWKTKMELTNVADRQLPTPDAPPSFPYEPWPAVSLLPYHFENPVTKPQSVPVALPAIETTLEAAQSRLAELQQSTQMLEDERDIEILQRTYGYFVDKNLWVQIRDLFARNGTLEIGGRGIFVGQDRALEYLQWLGEPVQGRLYDHTQMQGIVDVSPDGLTAKGRWRALVFGGDDQRSSIFGDCIYENEYIKEDGVWKIARLYSYFIMYTDMANGWEKLAWPNTRPEAVLPPDLPPTVVYDMYPGVITAPYHYENPVTGAPVYPSAPTADLSGSSVSELASLAAELNQRIALLDDVQQVERLQNAFGYYFDARNWEEAGAMFTSSATMERGQRGVYVGKERVNQSLSLYGEPGLHAGNVHQNIYYQNAIHVAPDGQSAQARFRTLNLYGDYNSAATLGGGVFENTYVKENGVWKIQSDHLYTTFIADYDGGWSHGALPVEGASESLPPDNKPTLEYAAFPTYYTFPFHYAHPVTGATILP